MFFWQIILSMFVHILSEMFLSRLHHQQPKLSFLSNMDILAWPSMNTTDEMFYNQTVLPSV